MHMLISSSSSSSNHLPLKKCETISQLQQLHAHSIINPTLLLSLPQILHTLTTLLFIPSPTPKPSPSSLLRYALSLFSSIPSPTTFSYNSLIRTHTLLSSPLPALRLFLRMRRLSLAPDSYSFPFLLKASSLLLSLPFTQSIHAQLFRFGFLSDSYALNSLLHCYSVCGYLDDARQVFDESTVRDVVSCNTLIDGFVKMGQMGKARELFDEMSERDSVSWGTLVSGYAQWNCCEEAIGLFEVMMDLKVRPENSALVSVLSVCARLGELEKGKKVHEYIEKEGIRVDSFLSTGLVDLYAKCGCVDAAIRIFESTSDRSLFTWNAMLLGLAMHGRGKMLLNYFARMVEAGIRPDGISFLGVLVGCSHGGLVDEARKLFDEMECVYGVERELKHYGCMADLLGRAGMIDEAMEMMRKMPMGGDVFVWSGLLGGCRIHGNVGVAEKAAKQVMELKPEDGGVYSILASVYANADRWEDVVKIRRTMSGNREVRKKSGFSLIRLDGAVHEFLSGDGLHSRSEDIYLFLKGMRQHQHEVW